MSNFTITDLIGRVVDNSLAEVYTSLPARVLEYYPEEQLVDVKPLIRKIKEGAIDGVEEAVVYRVPVVFPSSGGMLFSCRVLSDKVDGKGKGDIVLLQFSMRSISEWVEVESKQESLPKAKRNHNLSDAIAIVGLYTSKNHLQPEPKHAQWKFKNTKITLEDDDTDNSNIIIDTDGQTGITINVTQGDVNIDVNGDTNLTTGGNLNATVGGNTTVDCSTSTFTGDVNVDGDINCAKTVTATTDCVGGGISLKTHTHGGVTSGGATTLPPV